MSRILLHDHLDGGVRGDTMIKLSNGEFRGYRDPNCGSLESYLRVFNEVNRCLQDSGSLESVAYQAVEDIYLSGVKYFEIRFAPELHTASGLSVSAVIESVAAGIRDGVEAMGDIKGGLILCAIRGSNPASMTTNMRFISRIKEVVGLDLAGDENEGRLDSYRDFFRKGLEEGLGVTVHAGETGRWQNIIDAIEIGASRIGHGVSLQYAPSEVKRAVEKSRVCLEMCPSSNLHTGAIRYFSEHPLLQLLRSGFNVTINTDNRSVSQTSLPKEFSVVEQMGATAVELSLMESNAADAAFCDNETKIWIKSKINQR